MKYVNCPSCGGGGCGWQYECVVCAKQGTLSEEAAEAYNLACQAATKGPDAVFWRILAWKKGQGEFAPKAAPFKVGG